ncbi:LysR family transcriptional regulator [Comamonas testosteroni]|uniref:LysR family transcriptional regulator n=1 Tax=Comamonas testosteroni TaxID=285 RepID=UPI00389B1505
METAFLRSFIQVVETGSMAEASRRQNITPAAIAQQMRSLERDLGVTLMRRSGRTVQPTSAGHRLLATAHDLLRNEATLRTAVLTDEVAGELRLGAINTALHTMLPNILGRFAQAHPRVTVFIQSNQSKYLYDAIQQDQLDVAVCLHPRFELSKALAWQQLREEPLVVLAPEHLSDRDPLQLLRELPLLRYDRALGGGQQAERYLRRHGIAPRERFELSSLLAIAMMVDQGLGISLVPDIASPLTANLRLAKIQLPDAQESRRFGVLWPRSSPRAALVSAFLDKAKQQGGE